jgi:hypothetical protein
MSIPRGFGLNGKSIYMNVANPKVVAVSFVVDPANANGLGVSSVKSNGYVENVFMHTSATPGLGNGGYTNPNPAVGFALVRFRNNFNAFFGAQLGFQSPTAGVSLTVMVVGKIYTINTLGTSTQAQWVTAGLTPGITAAVGVAFVAAATSVGGTGTVMAPAASGIDAIETIGNSNLSLNNSNIAANAGGIVIVQFLAGGVDTAPTAQSVCSGFFWFDGSSVTVDGL